MGKLQMEVAAVGIGPPCHLGQEASAVAVGTFLAEILMVVDLLGLLLPVEDRLHTLVGHHMAHGMVIHTLAVGTDDLVLPEGSMYIGSVSSASAASVAPATSAALVPAPASSSMPSVAASATFPVSSSS